MTTVIKVVMCGPPAVGKTALIQRYTKKEFCGKYIMTIGAYLFPADVQVNNTTIKLIFWDLAGAPFFRIVFRKFYKDAIVAVVVFEITRERTFREVDAWIREIRSVRPDIPLVLVGNKVDLESLREVPRDTAQDFAKRIAADYIETSARDGTNVSRLFELIAKRALEYLSKKGKNNERAFRENLSGNSRTLSKAEKPS